MYWLLGINGVMFVIELGVGLLVDFMVLIVDLMDMFVDVVVYVIGIYVVGKLIIYKVNVVKVSGYF